jgi:hypothetical protein
MSGGASMRYVLIAFLAVVSPCIGTTPFPFYFECSLVDRVSDAAKAAPATRSIALEILERVAEGRMAGASPVLEVQIGLKAGQLHGAEFKESTVRAHALKKVGELDLPEALTYLLGLKRSDIEPDLSGSVWPAAQIALRQAQLNQVSDEAGKIRFLEDTTSERTAAASWAVNELCERGSFQSLPFIREQIRKSLSLPQDVKRENEFCEGRMGVISRDPDRVKALGSFLSVSGGVTDDKLLGWVIGKLQDMNSPRAEAELQRYGKEIDRLPEDSRLKRELEHERARIRRFAPPLPKIKPDI